MKFTLRQIQVFDAVVTHGSTLAAAKVLQISQPAVSKALSELEASFGARLFDRWKKRMVLNEVGRTFAPKARLVLANVRDLENHQGENYGQLSGIIQLGASTTPAHYILPNILSEFIQEHSFVKFRVSCRNKSTIIEQVLDFTLDIGIIAGHSADPDLISSPWIRDELCVFCAAEHPLAKERTIQAEDLLNQKWILREEGSGTREEFLNAIRPGLNSSNIAMEFDNIESIKRAVEKSQTLGCISRTAIKREVESGVLNILDTPFLDLTRRYSILLHKTRKQSSLLSYFSGYCRFGYKEV